MSAEDLSRGEKAAVTRQVHAGEEIHLKDESHLKAAKTYAKEVEAKEGGHEPASPKSHKPGELSTGEKASVMRAVHAGKDVSELPFVQDHPRKLERAQEYAAEVERKGS